jgi:hypothetical protein
LRGEEYRNERPEAGLYVGNEEYEPIEAAQTAPRGRKGRRGALGLFVRRRSRRACAAAPSILIVAEA